MKTSRQPKFSRRTILLNAAIFAVLACNAAIAAPPTSDAIGTNAGVLRITPKFHGSLQMTFAGHVIEIDPFSPAGYTRKADLILITHAHGDHLDPVAIKKLATASTSIIAPAPIIEQLRATIKTGRLVPLGNGSKIGIDKQISVRSARQARIIVEAVPMYNVVREREKGVKFHPKGVGNGYVLTLGGKRVYIAGDTEATPEMKNLKNIDIAFLPMNLPYTMTPQEAANGARAFKPKIVYPYHFRSPFDKPNTNAHQFAAALKGSGIQVRVRDWYPDAAVARATAADGK